MATSKSFLQILGTNTGDSSPSILAYFENTRYLFAVGEGSQRFTIENRVGLSKLSNIFLTRVAWEGLGGVPGMLLSLRDAGNRNITIHGGTNLTHYIAATRHFVFRMSSKVHVNELQPHSPDFQDANLRVHHVFIYPDRTHADFKRMNPEIDEHSSAEFEITEDDLESPARKRFKGDGSAITASNSIADRITSSLINDKAESVCPTSQPVVSSPNQPNGTQDSKNLFSPNRMSEAEALKRRHQVIHQMFNRAEALTVDGIRRRPPPHVKQPRSKFDPDATPDVSAGKRKATDLVRLPRTRPAYECICYIAQGPTMKGKFHPQKAKGLGAQPGNQFGMLYNRIPVTLDDGTVIYPDQVNDADVPGSIFIIIECPNALYIESLTKNSAFEPHFRGNTQNEVKVIIHILGDDVLDHVQYRNWMNEFPEDTQHLIISRKHCPKPIVFTGSAIMQYRLSMIDSEVFRVPAYDNMMQNLHTSSEADVPALPRWTIPATHLLIFQLNPLAIVDTTEQRPLFNADDPRNGVIHGIHYLEKFVTSAEEARLNVEDTKAVEDDYGPGADVMVTMLGTGAALPSRFRNVSSALISIPNYGHILLDAGEGTYGQMYRRFAHDAEQSVENILLNLKCIFISHMHADHHLGVIRLLLARRELCFKNGTQSPPLCIIGPPQYWIWLCEYSEVQNLGLDGDKGVHFIRADNIIRERDNVYNAYLERVKKTLGLKLLSTIVVDHCTYAYALIMQHQDSWKIVYSGDCRPSIKLMEALPAPNLLIHEATFEADHGDEAVDKRHCTTAEAVIVAGRMKAQALILTHFSQRYPRLPQLRRFGLYGGALVDLYPTFGDEVRDQAMDAFGAIDMAMQRSESSISRNVRDEVDCKPMLPDGVIEADMMNEAMQKAMEEALQS
ncbi:hypothetical protein SeMB42_g00852 [Synchytrium endobioticum]|uniref:ribonuclease Z n=1 Tax=Synchytrium endobioticum TaxID=286115 RepID=A0A507DNV9_9FUNG|nr:hypothetical protein SeMB42_g00852 [Synchytrium endobioticum]